MSSNSPPLACPEKWTTCGLRSLSPSIRSSTVEAGLCWKSIRSRCLAPLSAFNTLLTSASTRRLGTFSVAGLAVRYRTRSFSGSGALMYMRCTVGRDSRAISRACSLSVWRCFLAARSLVSRTDLSLRCLATSARSSNADSDFSALRKLCSFVAIRPSSVPTLP